MPLVLRPATPSDAQAAGAICHDAFKAIADHHRFPPDFPSVDAATGLMTMLLSRPDIHGVVAELDARVVGSNFLWESDAIAGVGPITVDPAVQDGGIGRALMQAVLERANQRRFADVRLVQAGYHCRSLSLYTKLGFDVREPLLLMQGPAPGVRLPGRTVRPAAEADVAACDRLCRDVHGHDRHAELLDAVRQETATVVEHEGRITGYATQLGFFGHAVGRGSDDLKALIGAAPSFAGPGFLLPTRNAELLRWCLQHGLRVVQPMTLMTIGMYREPAGAFLSSILY